MSRPTTGPIRVGVVGASPDRGWGTAAHLPALLNLEEYAVTAVATTRQDSARRAAAAFGVPHAFADAAELAAHPDVDVVAVVVKAPDHATVIRAALDHGKHVVSEWPLGVDLAEAVELAEAATSAGVVHAVVLQGFRSPAAGFVRDLIAGGGIGRLESVTVVADGAPLGGTRIPGDLAWSVDPAAGMNLLTIMAGHVLAMVEHLAGPLVEVSASLDRVHREVVVAETGRSVPGGVPGHVSVHGLLESGAVAVVSVPGGNAPGPDGFHLRITGSEGALTVAPAEPGMYPHWADWTVTRSAADGTRAEPVVAGRHTRPDAPTAPPGDALTPPPADALAGPPGEIPASPPAHVRADPLARVPEGSLAGPLVRVPASPSARVRADPLARVPAGPPANVAALYLEVARAIAEGREAHPSFHTAVRQHRVLAAVENASRTGVRQTLAP
ncbi:Gfo/Idh/MocA family oxidoreductase [Streptosporangium sp. V21-05]|uniref:Gfo/Idh/MocA family protein n=1 Tax=Streptosporangium sp. V21-05 TaxID=3446115 RepID=UPI003F53AC36